MSTFHSKREEVEQLLLAFLVSRKGSTTIHDLDADYKAQEGKSIPFKELGYATLLEFLRSIPQTLTVQKINNVFYCKGKSNDQTRHISQLVEGQKPSGRSIRARRKVPPSRYFPQTLPAKISIPFSTFRYVIEIIKKNVNGVDIRDIIQIVKGKIPNIQLVYSDVVDQLREVPHEVYIDNGVVYPVKQNIQTNQSYFEVPSTNIMFSGEEPENYEADIAVESPYNVKSGNKMPASSFIQEAVHKSKKLESPVKEIENVSEPYSLKDIPEPDEGSPDNVAVNASMLISERTKIRLEKLIEQYPDGIWCKELPRKYEETYKISLNYAELGFNSMREYAMQLPEIFHCQQPVPFGDFKLYYAKKLDSQDISSQSDSKMNLAQLHDIYMEEDTLAVPPNLSKDTCQKLIPDNVMTYEESVGFINVTYLEPESFFEVSVVEVFHPSFFWIQLRKKQQKFKAFMEDLAKFYSVEHTRYAIPPIVLNPCLNCACQYNGIWHRGIIKSVSPDHRVTVMFYDYGTICTYDAASVYYLHRKFSSLPAQAVPCGLVNVKPISGNSWSRSVVYKFAERTSRNPLIAIISSRNEKNNSMLVTLTDTFGEEDVHINDWLVKEKLAEYGRMDNMPDTENIMNYLDEIFSQQENTDDNKPTIKNSCDLPLISPQSTMLEEPSTKPPPGFSLNKLRKTQFEPSSNPFVYNESTINGFPDFPSDAVKEIMHDNIVLRKQLNDIWLKIYASILSLENKCQNISSYPKTSTAETDMNQVLYMLKNILLDTVQKRSGTNFEKYFKTFDGSIGNQTNAKEENSNQSSEMFANAMPDFTKSDILCKDESLSGINITNNPFKAEMQQRNVKFDLNGDRDKNGEISESFWTSQHKQPTQQSGQNIWIKETETENNKPNTSPFPKKLSEFYNVNDGGNDTELLAHKNMQHNSNSPFAPTKQLFDNCSMNNNTINSESLSNTSEKMDNAAPQLCNGLIKESNDYFLRRSTNNLNPFENIDSYKETVCEKPNNPCDEGSNIYDFLKSKTTWATLNINNNIQIPTFNGNLELEDKNTEMNFKIIYQSVEIMNKVIFIFQYENDGWMSTDELVQNFTSFTSTVEMLDVLDAHNQQINFKKINRSDCPMIFSELDDTPLKATRNSLNKIITIHFTPLKSVITILRVLKIISFEELKEVATSKKLDNNSILYQYKILLTAYKGIAN
ncbi:tudor domain-containing protein 5-like isoform X2 [Prorops nasuta]|uniref:tudor domain-containing protein 5-like isoform X2 n=1 Tax=Prorops nasuta TaxID=863751 RepID=UPI0034CFD1C6